MSRRALCFALALAIALVSYQPYSGISAVSAAAPVQMFVSSDSDCPNKTADDCCDETGKDKRICLWNDACVTRCHVNVGLEVAGSAAVMRLARAEALPFGKPRTRHKTPTGPLFRPPII